MIAAAAESAWTSAATATLVAAAITAAIALVGVWVNGMRAERNRRRGFYGNALAASMDYREFAFVVRRRQREMPAEERVRISEALRLAQKDLDHHLALMTIERSKPVEARYRVLVAQTREVAGQYMHESWESGTGIDTDRDMNVKDIDFDSLQPYVDDYLAAVRSDLAWWKL